MKFQALLILLCLPSSYAWSNGKCELSFSRLAADFKPEAYSNLLEVWDRMAPIEVISFSECAVKAEELFGTSQPLKLFGYVVERVTESVNFEYTDDEITSSGKIRKNSTKQY